MNKQPVETEVSCTCDGWKNGSDQIFSAQIRDTMITGNKYTGGVFEYCPWCGNKLVKAEEVAKAAGRE